MLYTGCAHIAPRPARAHSSRQAMQHFNPHTKRSRLSFLTALCILGTAGFLFAQSTPEFVRVAPNGPLDPAANLASMPTIGTFHTPLPEEYMWTAGDAAVFTHSGPLSNLKRNDWKMEPHFFRRAFSLPAPPPVATLYIAGPRKARLMVSGEGSFYQNVEEKLFDRRDAR